MKIVYLIGNGFDLAQKLETKYSDFYNNRLLSLTPADEIVKKMIQSIKDDTPSWADMEKRLGEFTSEMSGSQDVDDVYDFLKAELKSYLKDEQEKFIPSPSYAVFLQKRLTMPEACLQDESADSIKSFINSITSNNKLCEINVISFNYTDVFERAIGYKNKPIELDKRDDAIAMKLQNVYKVHGALDKEMVMGVADSNQIANKALASDLDALDVLVKPRTTSLRKDYVCTKASRLIANADIIVMHGLSIGETDKNWWLMVTERLRTSPNTKLIIYGHLEDKIDQYDYPRKRREERKLYKRLYECNGNTNITYSRLDKQVFVSLDDSFLHL